MIEAFQALGSYCGPQISTTFRCPAHGGLEHGGLQGPLLHGHEVVTAWLPSCIMGTTPPSYAAMLALLQEQSIHVHDLVDC